MSIMNFEIGGLYVCINHNPIVFQTFKLADRSQVRHVSLPKSYELCDGETILIKGMPFLVLSKSPPLIQRRYETCWQILIEDKVGWMYYTTYFSFEKLTSVT